MEGVGAGAVAAAALHQEFNLDAVVSIAGWEAGQAVPYAFLSATFDEIAPETKRLTIIATLTNAFRCVIAQTPEDLLPMVYLCVSRVRPLLSANSDSVAGR
jgi:DNA ligase 1